MIYGESKNIYRESNNIYKNSKFINQIMRNPKSPNKEFKYIIISLESNNILLLYQVNSNTEYIKKRTQYHSLLTWLPTWEKSSSKERKTLSENLEKFLSKNLLLDF